MTDWILKLVKRLPTPLIKTSLHRMEVLLKEKQEEMNNLTGNIALLKDVIYKRELNKK